MSDRTPRIGLVLGAGGVTGGAFHAGVLAALHSEFGWDPRRADIIVGTSAGSVAATTLRAGLSAADLLARAQDRPLSRDGQRLMAAVGPPRRPPPLRPETKLRRPGEMAALLARAVSRPFSAPPWALLSGLIPDGEVSTTMISEAIAGMFSSLAPDHWPAQPLWLCAVRQSDGKRFVFGKDARRAPLPDVVAASCAIPGFFAPVVLDGAAFVDGGVHSPTNADVLVDSGVNLVVVSSPMSLAGRRSPRAAARPSTSQLVRRWSGALLDAEVVRLRRRGVSVVAFQPTAADAEVMGANAMDARLRAAVATHVFDSSVVRLRREDTMERLAALRSLA